MLPARREDHRCVRRGLTGHRRHSRRDIGRHRATLVPRGGRHRRSCLVRREQRHGVPHGRAVVVRGDTRLRPRSKLSLCGGRLDAGCAHACRVVPDRRGGHEWNRDRAHCPRAGRGRRSVPCPSDGRVAPSRDGAAVDLPGDPPRCPHRRRAGRPRADTDAAAPLHETPRRRRRVAARRRRRRVVGVESLDRTGRQRSTHRRRRLVHVGPRTIARRYPQHRQPGCRRARLERVPRSPHGPARVGCNVGAGGLVDVHPITASAGGTPAGWSPRC